MYNLGTNARMLTLVFLNLKRQEIVTIINFIAFYQKLKFSLVAPSEFSKSLDTIFMCKGN